jgi:hypothetical protein
VTKKLLSNKSLFWIVIVGLVLLTICLIKVFPGALDETGDQIHLVYAIAILSYLVLALFSRRLEFTKAFQYLLIWLGIGLVLLVGYSFKSELINVKNMLRVIN